MSVTMSHIRDEFVFLQPPSVTPFSGLNSGVMSGLKPLMSGSLLTSQNDNEIDTQNNYTVLNARDGKAIVPSSSSAMVFENHRVSAAHRLHKTRWRRDYLNDNYCSRSRRHSSTSSWFQKRHPGALIPRKVYFELMEEDSQTEFADDMRNRFRSNLLRKISPTSFVHVSGPSMNTVFSSVFDASYNKHDDENKESETFITNDKTQKKLNTHSSQEFECEITALSKLGDTSFIGGSERLLTAITTSNEAYLIRLSSDFNDHLELSHIETLNCGVQLYSAPTNPSISSECAMIGTDGRLYVWDIRRCASSLIMSVHNNEKKLWWSRSEYSSHPRVLMIAQASNVLRIDLRETKPYNLLPVTAPTIINGFCTLPPFGFCTHSWDYLSLYDERFTGSPLLQWSHNHSAERACEIVAADSLLATFGCEDRGDISVYRYQSGHALAATQALDGLADMDPLYMKQFRFPPVIQGLSFMGDAENFTVLKLSDIGNIFCRHYKLAPENQAFDIEADASEDPQASLVRSSLTSFSLWDFRKVFNKISGADEDTQRILTVSSLCSFIKTRVDDLTLFLHCPRSLGEIRDEFQKRYKMQESVSPHTLRSALQQTLSVSLQNISLKPHCSHNVHANTEDTNNAFHTDSDELQRLYAGTLVTYTDIGDSNGLVTLWRERHVSDMHEQPAAPSLDIDAMLLMVSQSSTTTSQISSLHSTPKHPCRY